MGSKHINGLQSLWLEIKVIDLLNSNILEWQREQAVNPTPAG